MKVISRSALRVTERCEAQKYIWNQVWRRRLIYFITVFASIYLVLYPLIVTTDSSGEFQTRLHLVSTAIRALNSFLPGALSLWIEAYARDPSHFVVLGCLVVLLIWLGVKLGTKIEERMERIWCRYGSARMSNVEVTLRVVGGAVALFAIFHSLLPANWPMQQLLNDHINGWVNRGSAASVVVLRLFASSSLDPARTTAASHVDGALPRQRIPRCDLQPSLN